MPILEEEVTFIKEVMFVLGTVGAIFGAMFAWIRGQTRQNVVGLRAGLEVSVPDNVWECSTAFSAWVRSYKRVTLISRVKPRQEWACDYIITDEDVTKNPKLVSIMNQDRISRVFKEV